MGDLPEGLRASLADRYRIERELGRGGMATVYLARDLRHDRPVALKVLHPDLARSLGPDRFLREIRLAARLQHPHILTVLDSGAAGAGAGGDEVLWFTMPYIEGESLLDALGPISKDAFQGPYLQHQLVRIYILAGQPEKALDHLEPLLRMPYYLSPDWLRVDPTFDPLRQNPRFQRLPPPVSP